MVGLLGVESGQDAVICTFLYQKRHEEVKPYRITVAEFTDKISSLRNELSHGFLDEGLVVPRPLGPEGLTKGNISSADKDSLAYGWTPEQVFATVYGTGTASKPGGFYPKGGCGKIAQVYLHGCKESTKEYEKEHKEHEKKSEKEHHYKEEHKEHEEEYENEHHYKKGHKEHVREYKQYEKKDGNGKEEKEEADKKKIEGKEEDKKEGKEYAKKKIDGKEYEKNSVGKEEKEKAKEYKKVDEKKEYGEDESEKKN